MIKLRYNFYGTLTLNISHRTHIESIETAKLRFYSPSKLDLARRSRRFRNSDSVGDGTKIHALAHVCRPICPKRKVIGFMPLRCAYPLFLFAFFLSSSIFLLPLTLWDFFSFLLFFPIFLPIFLLRLFIHVIRWHRESIFVASLLSSNPSRSQFVGRQIQPRRRTRKEARFALGEQRRKTIIARLTITI